MHELLLEWGALLGDAIKSVVSIVRGYPVRKIHGGCVDFQLRKVKKNLTNFADVS